MGKVTKTGWCGTWVEEELEEGQRAAEEKIASSALEIARSIPKNRGRQEDGTRLPCRPRGTSKLQCLWDQAIIAVLSHGTIGAAAVAIGVESSTLSDWFTNPEFLDQLNEVRRQGLAHAILSMQGRFGQAADTLYEIMLDKSQPGATRHSAAKTITENVLQWLKEERAEEVSNARLTQMEKVRDELQLLTERSGEAEEGPRNFGGRSPAEAADEGAGGGDGAAVAEGGGAADE